MEEATDLLTIPYSFEKQVFPYSSTQVPAVSYPDQARAQVWVRLEVRCRPVEGNVPDAVCHFSWSEDGETFTPVERAFTARPGTWTGARYGFFCNRYAPKNDAGWVDVTDLDVRTEFQRNPGFNYDEARVPAYTLPDVFRMADGRTVRTRKDWEQVRRPELLQLFEEQMFGKAPGRLSSSNPR